MPFALERKYPAACREWTWQYVFPAGQISTDPRSDRKARHHISSQSIQRSIKLAIRHANITKPASTHTLRHYADNLIMPSS